MDTDQIHNHLKSRRQYSFTLICKPVTYPIAKPKTPPIVIIIQNYRKNVLAILRTFCLINNVFLRKLVQKINDHIPGDWFCAQIE